VIGEVTDEKAVPRSISFCNSHHYFTICIGWNWDNGRVEDTRPREAFLASIYNHDDAESETIILLAHFVLLLAFHSDFD
jgi:hypothetical protein